MRYTFDRFELDPELHRLTGADNRQITLRPQAFKVLEYLVRRAPSVVSRDELLKGVWGHNALSASGVAQAIREIRRALDDDATQPHIVATRHGCGYQVVATVIAHEITGEAVATPNEAPVARAHSPLATMAVFGLLLIGLVAGSYWFRPVPDGLRPSDGQFAALARIEGLSMPEGAEARAAFVQGVNTRRVRATLSIILRFSLVICPVAGAWKFAPSWRDCRATGRKSRIACAASRNFSLANSTITMRVSRLCWLRPPRHSHAPCLSAFDEFSRRKRPVPAISWPCTR